MSSHIARKLIQEAKESSSVTGWTCERCITCLGCRHLDIACGVQEVHPVPPSLNLGPDETLGLCSVCIVSYEKKQLCPNCRHVWEDVKYHKTQKWSKWRQKQQKQQKSISSKSGSSKKSSGLPEYYSSSSLNNNDAKEGNAQFDNSWFETNSPKWGFNESSMLLCDSCNLWTHAGKCSLWTTSELEPI